MPVIWWRRMETLEKSRLHIVPAPLCYISYWLVSIKLVSYA